MPSGFLEQLTPEEERHLSAVACASKIKSRKVTRYYVNRRGFQSPFAAAVAIAKDEIRWLMQTKASLHRAALLGGREPASLSFGAWQELCRAAEYLAYQSLFPGDCGLTNSSGIRALQHRTETYDDDGEQIKFCPGCRWDWIVARAKEIAAVVKE